MKVIGLCGEIGAGKDSFADYLVKQKGYHKVVMSEMITKELEKLGRPVDRAEMRKLGNGYREKYGRGVWAKVCLDHAKEQVWRRVIISGLRDTGEVGLLRKELGKDFLLVYITADPEIRYERIIKRGGPKDPKKIEEVKEQDEREKEKLDLYTKFKEYADETIANNGLIVELWAKADLLLKDKGFEAK